MTTSNNCWIDPTGRVHDVGIRLHSAWADAIGFSEKQLEEKGWIKISNGRLIIYPGIKISKGQYRTLKSNLEDMSDLDMLHHFLVGRRNPPNPKWTKVMSYAQARRWEPEARRRGVSQVARSSRGFMRAYQRAGSFAKLPEAWKRKREAFIARHMAQGKKEDLWEDGKPSRRALALIMWAYKPPKR